MQHIYFDSKPVAISNRITGMTDLRHQTTQSTTTGGFCNKSLHITFLFCQSRRHSSDKILYVVDKQFFVCTMDSIVQNKKHNIVRMPFRNRPKDHKWPEGIVIYIYIYNIITLLHYYLFLIAHKNQYTPGGIF